MDEAVCIASGPSLEAIDCTLVRHWRDAKDGRGVVVTNNTFRACPWADALYAMDNEWWRQYGKEVAETFDGDTYSRYGNYGTKPVLQHGHNSGAGAILLAAHLGAKRIILIGYDCKPGAKKHWHEDHKRPLGNCESMPRWFGHFEKVAQLMPDIRVVNCSRDTALRVFPRGVLIDELHFTV